MPATMSPEQKQRVKQALLAHATERLENTVEVAGTDAEAGEVVVDDATSVDDTWRGDQSDDMATLLDDAADQREGQVAAVEALDFSPTDVVRPGAIVQVEGQRYVVGVVLDELVVDGESYAGLSEESPLYQAVEGHRAGDVVSFREAQHAIELVA